MIRLSLVLFLAITTCATQCWSDQMKLVPTTPLTKVLRTTTANLPDGALLKVDAAAGETVSAQVVLVPGDKADTLTARLSELRSADGKPLAQPDAARLQWVRYLDITKNSANVPLDELVAAAPVSIPDPFWEDAERPVEPGKVQPLWIEIEVPSGAPAGDYTGELTVSGKAGSCALPVTLHVREFALSRTPHQRVIQWWQFPGHGFEKLKPGTDAYWKHVAYMCRFVAQYRQTDVWGPWELVERKTKDDGSSYWDTSLFEKYVDIALKSGIQAVHLSSVAKHTKFQLEQDSKIESIADNMERLAAIQKLITKRGWKGKIFVGIADEPFIYQEKTYGDVVRQVRKTAPDVKIIEAVETDNIGDLDVYVPKLSHIDLWWPKFQEMQREGKEIWYYTCCHPMGRYPNRFLDQPLVLARELHWISYLYGLDGFLHWGLNWFRNDFDPYSEDGCKQAILPPGDSQVAYPVKDGFVGSLRLSEMRDGLQDYEYLWTLEHRLRALKAHVGSDASWLDPRQRPLELCKRVVQSFYDHTRDQKVLLDTRAAIADEIEALDAKPLLYVQTSPPDGAVTPEGPITINVRGLATPGSRLTINGIQVIPDNITASGSFIGTVDITAEKPEIVVTAELDGVTRTEKRVFAARK